MDRIFLDPVDMTPVEIDDELEQIARDNSFMAYVAQLAQAAHREYAE